MKTNASHSIKSAETPESIYPPQKAAVDPITFRLPRMGERDPYFGMARSWWNLKILPSEANHFTPEIKSIVERQPGNIRGIRLIWYASAKVYFEALAAKNDQ